MPTAWWRWPLTLWLHCTDHLYSSRFGIWWFSLRGRSICSSWRRKQMNWNILWQRHVSSHFWYQHLHNGPDCPNRLPVSSCFCIHPRSLKRHIGCISGHNLEKGNKYKNRVNSLNLKGRHTQLSTHGNNSMSLWILNPSPHFISSDKLFSEKNGRNVRQTCRGLTQFSFVFVA